MLPSRFTAAALTGVIVAMTGCADVSVPLIHKSAADLAAEALDNLASAAAVAANGSFSQAGHRVDLRVVENRKGGTTGTVTEKGHTYMFRFTAGRTFVQADEAFWSGGSNSGLGRFYGGQWVGDPRSGDVLPPDFVHNLALYHSLRSHRQNLRRDDTTAANQPAAVLHDTVGDFLVSTTGPARFLRIVSAAGYATATGRSDFRLDLTYPAARTVPVPPKFIDTSDRHAMPAGYSVVILTFEFGACDFVSCTMSVKVQNDRGAVPAEASVELQLRDDHSRPLMSCMAPIPPIGLDQIEVVSCTVSGPEYQARRRNGESVYGGSVVHNPTYGT
jgi:hypothetical protein